MLIALLDVSHHELELFVLCFELCLGLTHL
jgi:hypothetical protein